MFRHNVEAAQKSGECTHWCWTAMERWLASTLNTVTAAALWDSPRSSSHRHPQLPKRWRRHELFRVAAVLVATQPSPHDHALPEVIPPLLGEAAHEKRNVITDNFLVTAMNG
jgi:hypothetical protein